MAVEMRLHFLPFPLFSRFWIFSYNSGLWRELSFAAPASLLRIVDHTRQVCADLPWQWDMFRGQEIPPLP